MKTFAAQTIDQWRKWLDEHHDSESEVWLIFYKRHTGGSIAHSDAAAQQPPCSHRRLVAMMPHSQEESITSLHQTGNAGTARGLAPRVSADTV